MGLSHSVREVISLKDAMERLTHNEIICLENAYKRLCPRDNILGIRTEIFQREILCDFPYVPKNLAHMLFQALDRQNNGCLTWEDLLCGFVVLKKGTQMEQLTLLFYVYDTERRGSIDKWQVRTLARIFSKDASIKNEDLLTPELYGKLFQDSEIVKAKDFIEWASRPKAGKKMFVWWIYDLARCLFHGIAEYNKLSSPDSSNTVKKILSKRGRRKSSGKDAASRDHIVLSFLRERYNALEAALSKTGRPSEGKNGVGANEIDIDSIFSPPIPTKLLNIVFFYVDKSNVGVVDAAEFVSTIARLFTGTLEYQLEFLFKMFDKDDDAMLSFNEIISLIRCMAEIEEEFDAQKLESGLRPETVSQFRRALTKAAFGRTKATMLASKKHSLSELISLSVNHALQSKQDRRMSLQEWKVWSSQNSELFLFSQRSVQNAIEFARRRLSPVEEREMVKKALNAKQYSATKEREGQVWFIISKKWWQSWDRYTLEATNRKSMYEFSSEEKGSAANLSFKNDVSIGRDRPGKIDQTDILEEGSDKRLRTDISRQTHYAIISETIWKYLLSWYGGGPAIPRRVVKDENRLELEMYPITIRVCRVGENHERLTHCIEMSISRFYTILMLKQIASSQLGLRPKEIRLWDCRHSDPKMVMLLPTTKEVETRTVEQMGFIDGQEVLVEQRERSGRWPNVVDSNVQMYTAPSSTPGLAGLYNLGNTCYMNSSLQCLLSIPMLSEYFSREYHIGDLNPDATLGSNNAQLACAFILLSEKMVGKNANSSSFPPRLFKKILGRFKEMFTGYEQHDSQEFLTALMDGLHEDLNRVKKKPYTEMPDSNGRPDKVVAKEWWDNHLNRDDSIIQSIFAGQFKSECECAVCGFESARFEPFTMMQLPLPDSSLRIVKFNFVFQGTKRTTVRCAVRVPKRGNLVDVKEALENDDPKFGQWPNVQKINACNLIFVLISSSNIHQNSYKDGTSVDQLCMHPDNLFCFQLDHLDLDDLQGDSSGNGSDEENSGEGEKSFSLGQIVKARWKKGAGEYPATIVKVHTGGEFYDVKYEDGDVKAGVSAEDIFFKPPSRVLSIFVHRRRQKKRSFFLEQNTTALFGTPFLKQFVNETTSKRQLYLTVWEWTRNMFEKVGTNQAADTPTDPPPENSILFPNPNFSELEDDEDTTNMAELVKKLWGFSLHFVRHDGRGCSHCNWLTKCRGCLAMPYNDQMVPTLKNGSSFAIDWSESSLRAMKSDSQLQSFPRHESLHKCESYETKVLSIHQCMNRYISKEKLDGNDQVYCSKCKEHRDHRKQVTLFRPPPVLILHLKRFKFAYNRGVKISKLVNCPLNGLNLTFAQPTQRHNKLPVDLTWWEYLGGKYADEKEEVDESRGSSGKLREDLSDTDAADYVLPEALYDCVAVVNHYGSYGGGHYVACTKNPVDKKWRMFDDSHVKVIQSSNVITENAYILFYLRRDISSVHVESMFDCSKGSMEQREQYAKCVSDVQGSVGGVPGKCTVS